MHRHAFLVYIQLTIIEYLLHARYRDESNLVQALKEPHSLSQYLSPGGDFAPLPRDIWQYLETVLSLLRVGV